MFRGVSTRALDFRFAMLVAGLGLLLGAWVVATQPFAAPDEAAHYLRALNIANGQILGPRYTYRSPTVSPAALDFLNHDARTVVVPAKLSPPNIPCVNGKPDVGSGCVEPTYEGGFPPLAYLLPAAAIGVSRDSGTALWLGRVGSALAAFVLLLVGFALLWTGTAWSIVGLLAATTPMVLFVLSVLNPSGLEVAACLAFACAALRISRQPSATPTWVWAAFALSGAAGIVAWPLGIVFVAGELVLFGSLLGVSGVREAHSAARRPFLLSALTLATAAAVWVVYARVSDATPAKLVVGTDLHGAIPILGSILRQGVGSFGSVSVWLPHWVDWIWFMFALVLIAAALVLGTRRERVVVVGVTLVTLAFPVLFYAWVERFSGFGLQGRDVLPALALIPLTAGEVLYRRRASVSSPRIGQIVLSASVALLALLQAYAWFLSARAAAAGTHRVRFYADAAWAPPLGWWPWIGAAGLGVVSLLMFSAAEAGTGPSAVARDRVPAREPQSAS